ncbi:phospholipid metabolism enzyme [Colletotrichum camelliae]|nr:phospholipid metabolism enzyme [Colletotrichum camelliae]
MSRYLAHGSPSDEKVPFPILGHHISNSIAIQFERYLTYPPDRQTYRRDYSKADCWPTLAQEQQPRLDRGSNPQIHHQHTRPADIVKDPLRRHNPYTPPTLSRIISQINQSSKDAAQYRSCPNTRQPSLACVASLALPPSAAWEASESSSTTNTPSRAGASQDKPHESIPYPSIRALPIRIRERDRRLSASVWSANPGYGLWIRIGNGARKKVNEKLAHEAAASADNVTQVDRAARLSRGSLHTTDGDTGTVRVRSQSTAPVPTVTRQSSVLSNKQGKNKAAGEGSGLIVETETVSSIPQVALAPAAKLEPGTGTLRAKPSTETIRPKKEKKKTSRKQPTVNPGNASSKADIFEAKVASAVDEANTSDSEETFVYDSNPPDVGERRRYHSRTPSATSMISQADRAGALGMRSIHEALQVNTAAGLKKSMKFVNTFNSNGAESLGADDDGKGSGRSAGVGSGRGTGRHHHHNHFGRWGRHPGNTHPSLFDNESLFPNAARSKMSANNSRQSSGPPSPRVASSARGGPHALGKRSSIQMARYDADDTTTTGADDERTPLLTSTVRSARRTRRHPANLRNIESQSYRQQPSYLNRFAACLVVTMMLLLVITGAIGFMFATSQPLTDIELVSIKNVLSSDPELMFDLTVKAHNPNIVVVSIDQANLEIFAKSPHAGTDFDWWKRPHGDELEDPGVHILDDPPDDPPDDDAAPNMRLGTIIEFDSPLSFEGSFFNKGVSASTGTMRLHLPGNHSAGGSERWGRIIQDEFDLIVKGVVRYSLPLSQRVRSAPISGRTTVKPNSANDPSLQPNMTLPGDLPELES